MVEYLLLPYQIILNIHASFQVMHLLFFKILKFAYDQETTKMRITSKYYQLKIIE